MKFLLFFNLKSSGLLVHTVKLSLFGIMISDYYFIQKGNLNNKDIYSLESNGAYYYTGGWHLKGVYALILGFVFLLTTSHK